MQKKHFLLVVISLALLSTIVFVGRSNLKRMVLDPMMGSQGYSGVMGGMGGDYMGDGYMGYSDPGSYPAMTPMLETKQMAIEPMMDSMLPYYYGDDALDVTDRSYEKSAYHSVVVSDVSKYMRGLKEYFASIDAVVLNTSVSSFNKYESSYLYVKVPVAQFDEATNRVTQDVKKIMDESVSAYDITGQVVNTSDALVALQEQKALKEAQIKDAKTEVEKTKIQIEVDRLTRQIAAAQKNQEATQTRTQYASISITAASNEKYFNPGSTGDFGYELERAWESLKSFVKVLLVFGIWMVVYSVIWAPVVWLVSKVMAKFKKQD